MNGWREGTRDKSSESKNGKLQQQNRRDEAAAELFYATPGLMQNRLQKGSDESSTNSFYFTLLSSSDSLMCNRLMMMMMMILNRHRHIVSFSTRTEFILHQVLYSSILYSDDGCFTIKLLDGTYDDCMRCG